MTCKRGHDEWRVNSKGHRECRACLREMRQEKRRLARPVEEAPPLAVTRPRQLKRRKDARLSTRQIHAAYKLYEAGMDVPEIAEKGWRVWGYASKVTCCSALWSSFRLEGLLTRKAQRRCTRCGCDYEERTSGCRRCKDRHADRKKRGLPYLSSPIGRGIVCISCGGSVDRVTEGCRTCVARHAYRNSKARPSEEKRAA